MSVCVAFYVSVLLKQLIFTEVVVNLARVEVVPASSNFRRFQKLWEVTISFNMSVRLSALNNSAPTRRISAKFDI